MSVGASWRGCPFSLRVVMFHFAAVIVFYDAHDVTVSSQNVLVFHETIVLAELHYCNETPVPRLNNRAQFRAPEMSEIGPRNRALLAYSLGALWA